MMGDEKSVIMFNNNGCYLSDASNPNELWKSGNTLVSHAPILFLQIAFNISISNFFYHILKPLHQPRLIAEVLGGFTLSLILAQKPDIAEIFIPIQGVLTIETYTSMGLMCYVFLSGLEMNLDNILQTRRKATSIAIAGIIIPILIGMALFGVIDRIYEKPQQLFFQEDDRLKVKAYLFWSLALIVTGFPVLAHIVSDLKLLYTPLGKASLTAAMISDIYGWVLFIILIPFASNDTNAIVLSVLSTIVFLIFCIFGLRPLITQYIDKKTEQDTWDNKDFLFVLMGVFVFSFITDALGTHYIVGAFMYGLILPHGRFADLLMEKLDNFVSGAMSSLFFFRSGLTVNLYAISQQKHWLLMTVVILVLSIPKVISTIIATFFFGVSTRDGVGIGLLLNSKGVLSLIILNVAWDRKILSVVAFSIMVSAIFIMTVMVPPLINAMYRPRKQYERYRLRTLEKLRVNAELRVITCVHNIRQSVGMVGVLKLWNATRISPLHVFGVHLVELTGRATSVFATHMEQPSHSGSSQNLTLQQEKSENIRNAFNALEKANHAIRVETLDAVSTYETIHEDIYSLAEQKRTTLIIIPFHKQSDSEGFLEITNETSRDINLNVLHDSPCSVAIFVDRGLGSCSRTNLRILMLFVGGPDDREALAVAWRMAGQSENRLSMVKILMQGEAAEVEVSDNEEAEWLERKEDESDLDEEFVDSFRFKAVYNNDSITYSEEEIHNGEELTSLLHELDKDEWDLYIVGQGSGRNLRIFSKFLEWCDNPELGVIGDIVASNSFGSRSSLLVVQQFGWGKKVFGSQTNPTQYASKSQTFERLV